ncbi:MAG: hypothetical protein EAZ55_07515 [Cytophagales bacterium]|nr:MAG: hypothetical protein EAZ55_07515 [Cytophagales bacterium]
MACSQDDQKNIRYHSIHNSDWHSIDLGLFTIDAPKSFRCKIEKGIDSFIGIISNDTIRLHFDYGYYSLPFETEKSYLEGKKWLPDAELGILVHKKLDAFGKLEVINISNHTAELKLGDSTFFYKIPIPDSIQDYQIEKDTTADKIYEISYPKNNKEGIVSLRITRLDKFNPSMENHIAILVSSEKVKGDAIKLILKMYKTFRFQ